MRMKKNKVGLIGYGYWGPVLLRNFHNSNDFEVLKVCDHNPDKLAAISNISPNIKICNNHNDILKDSNIDTVVITTQASTHYDIVKESLEHNKNVFVEKPLTLSSENAIDIIKINHKEKLKIMVDHTYLFTQQYKKLKKIIENKELGNILHYHSTRADFGLFQKDANILWHLFYHDAYILLDLLGKEKIKTIKASGSSHILDKVADTAYASIKYESGLTVEVLVNMLFPEKERKVIVTGDKKILYWDDTMEDKLKIYNKSAFFDKESDTFKYGIKKESEKVPIPQIEALKTEIDYFADCIHENTVPMNDENSAYQVIQLIENTESALNSD